MRARPVSSKLLPAALLLALLPAARAEAGGGGSVDPLFDPGANPPNSTVLAVASQPDGKVVIGGYFTTLGSTSRNGVARLNPDGTLDTTFDPGGAGLGTFEHLEAIRLQADGKILIGGSFTSYDGDTSVANLARLNADGSLDTSFVASVGQVFAIAIAADNRILAGGSGGITRLNLDGSVDSTFNFNGSGADNSVLSIALEPDGRIVIGGYFQSYNLTSRSYVARLNADGTLDTGFDPGSDAPILTLAAQPDGKVLLGGYFTTVAGGSQGYLARLDSAGALDTSFTPAFSSTVLSLALQPDGRILVGGYFESIDFALRNGIGRLNPDGTLDTSFDPGTGAESFGFVGEVDDIAAQADGRVVIGGYFDTVEGSARAYVARLLPALGTIEVDPTSIEVREGAGSATLAVRRSGGTDTTAVGEVALSDITTSPADYVFTPGALDPSFDPGAGPDDTVNRVALQPDGKLLIGGRFTAVGGVSRAGVARLNADGTLDTTFADPGAGEVRDLAIQPDGKVVIVGTFSAVGGQTRFFIARLNADGTLDTTFDPGAAAVDIMLAVAVQPDGKILVGGNGPTPAFLARLNSDGSLDTTFNPPAFNGFNVLALALQSDGRVLVGGDFTSVTVGRVTVSAGRIARLNPDGSVDPNFDLTGVDAQVSSLVVQPDGKILLGGAFASPTSGVARLNPDGTLDSTFTPGAGLGGGAAAAVALPPDGKILAGGGFTTVDGTARAFVARLNADGTLDGGFDPGAGVDAQVNSVAMQGDGRVVLGGAFTLFGGTTPRNRVARLQNDFFVTWPWGDGSVKTIQLPIVDDTLVEGAETLQFDLFEKSEVPVGVETTGTLAILDDDTETSLASSPNPSAFGQAVTFKATVGVGLGSGTPSRGVTFTADSLVLDSVALDAAGQATFAISSLAVGTHTIAATYPGDSIFVASSSAPLTQEVQKAGTSTAVGSSPNPSAYGQSVTFTAAVTVLPPGAATPFGLVVFKDGVATLGTAALGPAGTASFTTASLPAGTRSITASYQGIASLDGSASPILSQTVDPAASSVALASSADPTVFGQIATFTATVTGAGAPSGTVTFHDGGVTVLGTAALDGAGQAVLQTALLDVGPHSITAGYSGDANHGTAVSAALAQTVNQAGSSVSLASSANPVAQGQPVTFTATVAAVAPGAGTPSGSVSFTDGATTLGSAPLDTLGQATLAVGSLAAGAHAIAAQYTGDARFLGATSPTLAQTVAGAATSTVVASSANPSAPGQAVTFTASVYSPFGAPTGGVIFLDGLAQLGSAALNGGAASLTTSSLSTGSHSITGVYQGDGTFQGSTSPALDQTVSASLPPSLSIGNATMVEGDAGSTDAIFGVTLSSASGQTVTVDYATADGTATASSDYTPASGTLTFAPGETAKIVRVAVLGDTLPEPDETFVVNLSGASGATIASGQGVGTIQDDDIAVGSFTVSPVVAAVPGTATLSWSVVGATSVTISGVSGTFGASGTAAAPFTQSTTFTLTATGAGRSVTARATVNLVQGQAPLAAPAITTPVSGQVVGVAGVTLGWNAVAGASGYGLYVFDAQTGRTRFSGSLSGGGSTSALLSLPGGSHTFVVRACAGGYDDASCGPYAAVDFAVSLAAPAAAPSVAAPADGSSLTASTVTLAWTAVAGASSYEVVLRDLVHDVTALGITVFDPETSTIFSLGSGSYELTVRACQAACGPPSSPSRFDVSLPAVPTAASTITSATLSGTSLTVTWTAVTNADLYQIQVVQPGAGPGGGALTVAARQVSATSATFEVPAGALSILVSACNGNGCGPLSAAFAVTASQTPLTPNLGTPLAGTTVAGPTVLFSWNRVPSDDGSGNTIYRLFVADLSRQATALDVHTRDNFYAAYFRAEGARYDAQVVADPGCTGPGAPDASGGTCPAAESQGPPAGFNVSGASATAPTMTTPAHQSQVAAGNVMLAWTPVPGATLYQYYVSGGGQNPAATGVATGLFAQVPLAAVNNQATPYVGIVRACPAGAECAAGSDAGWGPWSDQAGPGVTNFTVTP